MASILCVSTIPSHPQDQGNRIRVYNLLSGLQRHGHEVHFLYLKRRQKSESRQMERQWDSYMELEYNRPRPPRLFRYMSKWSKRVRNTAMPYGVDYWYDETVTDVVERSMEQTRYDVVMVQYVFISKLLESVPGDVTRIIDTHDVLADRHKIYEQKGLQPSFFYTTRHQEAKGLNRADVVLANDDREQQYFRKLVSRKTKVVTVGTPIRICEKAELRTYAESHRVAFIGSRNLINLEAVKYLMDQVWPLLIARSCHYTLEIVGGIGELLSEPRRRRCNVVGRVADVGLYYKKADVIVNPVQECTGTQTKNLEAFGYGKPLVTTSLGARGYEKGRGKAFLTGDTPQKFAERIESLFADRVLYRSVAAGAYRFAESRNRESVRALLDTVSGQMSRNQ